jgi:hypothetical protein
VVVAGLLGVSLMLTLGLLLVDVEPSGSSAEDVREAREQLTAFFGSDVAPPRPFQLLLREAQRAHARGDRDTERARYRQVLELLRAESRSPSRTLTATAGDDAELERLLTILLHDSGRAPLP